MRWGRVAIAGVLVVSLIAAGRFSWQRIQHDRALERVCASVTSWVASTPVSVGSGATKVHVVGDSYSAGWTLEDVGSRWVDIAARHGDWSVTVQAWPGAGYTTPGPCDVSSHQFPNRTFPASDITLVVGGLNDVDAEGDLTRAALSTIEAAKRTSRRVVIVGPTVVSGRRAAGVHAVSAALRDAAAAGGAEFVDATSWKIPLGPDGLHPHADGHAVYARLIVQAVT